jgi:hypothetical protein
VSLWKAASYAISTRLSLLTIREIRDKEKAGPVLLQDGRDTGMSDRRIKILAKIEKVRQAESHRSAAESRAAAATERAPVESAEPETQPSAEQNDEYARHFAEAAKQYPDFEETVARGTISNNLDKQIRAIGNAREIAQIAYYLGKNPAFVKELEKDPSQLARISPTVRHSQLQDAHGRRMAADPDAAAAVAAAGNLPIRNELVQAVLEQDNSNKLVEHFAKNPEVLEELNQLPPSAAVSRLGRIAEQLASRAAKRERERERVRPPEPLSPVGNSATRSGMSLEDMPLKDFFRVRAKQERDNRRYGR